jgi:peroxiredoxin
LIGASVAAAALYALLTAPSTPPPLGRGSPAPAFELELLGGDGSLALSDLRGRVVLVNFWATWCESCEEEMPAMERLYRMLRAEGFELLAISVDSDAGEVAEFRDRLQLSFPIPLDPDKEVATAYQIFRFPESLLIGRDGLVAEKFVGPKDWDAPPYVARIRRLLQGDGAPE